MKRIFALFMCLLFISAFICSCKIETDPFVTTGEKETDTFVTTGETGEMTDSHETAPDTEPTVNIYEDTSFFALNRQDSYEKYGMLSFSPVPEANMDNTYDGLNMYSYSIIGEGTSTLCQYVYPDTSTNTKVCKDPLCNHKGGCPFYNVTMIIACYEGKIYFNTQNGNIYVYDVTEGKRSKLLENTVMPRFIKYGGKLYLQYLKELTDFNMTMTYCEISPSGEITELGQLSDINTNFGIIYNDEYYIDYQTEIKGDKGILYVLKRDIKTGAVSTAAAIETSRNTNKFDDLPVNSCMLYGDKLLVDVRYLRMVKKGVSNEIQEDFFLVDLISGENRLICTPDFSVYGSYYVRCLFSQKCIVWYEPRKKESNPIILHVLFPYTGEEKTYDLSKMVYDATGDTIPLDVWITDMVNSAIRLQLVKNDKLYDLYLIDLENGSVYKNDVG